MRPHQDIAIQPKDISRVIALALDYNPMLATADMSTIRMWANEGCSVELDIIPTIEAIIKKPRPKKIGSFSYFTNAVLTARDKRGAVERTQPIELSKEQRDANRAQNIRWHMDRGINSINVGPQDYAWLEQYEKLEGSTK